MFPLFSTLSNLPGFIAPQFTRSYPWAFLHLGYANNVCQKIQLKMRQHRLFVFKPSLQVIILSSLIWYSVNIVATEPKGKSLTAKKSCSQSLMAVLLNHCTLLWDCIMNPTTGAVIPTTTLFSWNTNLICLWVCIFMSQRFYQTLPNAN